jgi:hypothetical protein
MKKFQEIFKLLFKLYKHYPIVISLILLTIIFNKIWLDPLINYMDFYFTPDPLDSSWIKFCEEGPKYFIGPNSDWYDFSYNQKRFAFYYEKAYYKLIKIFAIIFSISFVISLTYALNLPFYDRIYLKIKKLFNKIIKYILS